MNEVISDMFSRYHCSDLESVENATKEIVQEVTLLGLSRSTFFSSAAFYGGTALRIFHRLPRFSEDMDFTLEQSDRNFDLAKYLPYALNELEAYGLALEANKKEKTKINSIRTAFLKGNERELILEMTQDRELAMRVPANKVMKIKVEIDVDPPAGANTQTLYSLVPSPYRAKLYDMPSMFASKIHALLLREYSNRVKGRDFYDYMWYLSQGTTVNLGHLQHRMERSGKWDPKETLTLESLKAILAERFETVDYDSARADVFRFLKDEEKKSLDIWSSEFFMDITEQYLK